MDGGEICIDTFWPSGRFAARRWMEFRVGLKYRQHWWDCQISKEMKYINMVIGAMANVRGDCLIAVIKSSGLKENSCSDIDFLLCSHWSLGQCLIFGDIVSCPLASPMAVRKSTVLILMLFRFHW